MKKVLSFVCAVAVAATCTATAFAADDTATPGQIAQEVIGQVHGDNLNPAQCKMVIDQVLKPLTKGGETHVSKAVASLGHLALLNAAPCCIDQLTLQNSEVFELKEAVPAPAQSQTAVENEAAAEEPVVENEAAAAEQPAAEPAAEDKAAAEQPAEEPAAEDKAAAEQPAAEPAAEDKAAAEQPAAEPAAEDEAAAEQPAAEPAAEDEAAAEQPAEEPAAEDEAAAEQPAEEPAAEDKAAAEQPAAEPAAEDKAAAEQPAAEPAAAAEQPAAEPAAEAEAAAEQPVAETKPEEQAEKQFGAIQLCTAAAQTIDFAKVTGSIVDQGKNVYTLTVNMPAGVTNDMTPAGYEVTVYGLNSDNYQMVHGTDVNSEARLDNVIRIAANEKDSTKLDVTFWVPHFSTYTIFPVKAAEQQKPDTDQGSQGSQSSNGSSGSSGYEAPDDSIYYTCPKCGYHNWTAAEGGYLCDHCGYMEVVKELAGWPNVNGVAVKTSNPASLSAVYAGAIKATGASMSMLALAVVAMAAAAVGGAAYLVRKNGLGE